MRQLTWVSGSFSARVLAARLESEGIDVQLRGAIDGPYGLTVGEMARVDLWVPEDQLDDASLVLLAGEVDAALAAPGESGRPADEPLRRRRLPRWLLWVAITVLATAGLAPIVVWAIDG